ncbi:MAG: cupin domain-containing protein [Saprospiraceae bacterium]|nr:cupin domain-containing protein [Saprospiraceae bacterium]
MKNRFDIWLNDLSKSLTDESGNEPTAEDLDKTEAALLAFAELHAVKPPLSMRDKILANMQRMNSLEKNRQTLSLNHLPLLTAESNWLDWAEVVKDIAPPTDFDGIRMHLLEDSPERELNLVWVKEEVPEEVHHDVLESFILLEGSCECHIFDSEGNSRIVYMHQGDYISFKIGEVHDIHITSAEPAKAILQWLKLAA